MMTTRSLFRLGRCQCTKFRFLSHVEQELHPLLIDPHIEKPHVTMSFSSRRRNYLLTPHRRDGLIEWMKKMLSHSFVLDCLETTGADTFSHFELLIEEHRKWEATADPNAAPSRLKQLVPTIGSFHTNLPLREAFLFYNNKHKLTARKHIQISFNEIRHILNMAQIMAFFHHSGRRHSNDDDESDDPPGTTTFNGPKLITFDGDQTLYSDGSNFEGNPRLAKYLYTLLKNGVNIAVVTAAGYEYNVAKYEFRLSGLLNYFKQKGLTAEECDRFYLFGGECNYLLKLGNDYKLQAIKENGAGGWFTATRHLPEAPGNWEEDDVQSLLDIADTSFKNSIKNLNIRGRVIRKKRSVGLCPRPDMQIPREALDETVLSLQDKLSRMNSGRVKGLDLPRCIFNGGTDAWCDVGNKRVGVLMLQSYLGIPSVKTLHIGDQFLNTGNDYAARDVCPCVWITAPDETTYILKSILRLAGLDDPEEEESDVEADGAKRSSSTVDFSESERRAKAVKVMDVYTGEMITKEGD